MGCLAQLLKYRCKYSNYYLSLILSHFATLLGRQHGKGLVGGFDSLQDGDLHNDYFGIFQIGV